MVLERRLEAGPSGMSVSWHEKISKTIALITASEEYQAYLKRKRKRYRRIGPQLKEDSEYEEGSWDFSSFRGRKLTDEEFRNLKTPLWDAIFAKKIVKLEKKKEYKPGKKRICVCPNFTHHLLYCNGVYNPTSFNISEMIKRRIICGIKLKTCLT